MSNKSQLIEVKLIASNANTILKCGDYSPNAKCFLFGSCNLIHVYDPFKCKTFFTLNHHTNRVNGVKWFDSKDLYEFISIGADGKILHWINLAKDHNPFDISAWKLEKEYKSSDSNKSTSINLITSLYLSSIEKYFAIFTSNGILDLFYFDVDLNEFKMFSSLNYSKKLQDTLCFTVLNESYLLLLTGGYDSLINVHLVMRIKKMNQKLQCNIGNPNQIKPCELIASLVGHTNAIRDIAAISPETHGSEGIFFCSSSQDNYIRTWNIIKLKENEFTALADKMNINKTNSIFDEYKSKTSYVVKVESEDDKANLIYEYYNITLDSVLSGHEDSISSVQWGKVNDSYAILSSSFDFSVVVWTFDKKYNIWNKEYTLGEMLGNRHAFYYSTFLNDYKQILAYAYNGAFYLWKMDTEGQYKNTLIIHGHFGEVSDIDWDPSCNILFSCSKDETTRAFAYWKNNNTWHEVNRPQIHGYEINSLVCSKQIGKNNNIICKLISAADEKLLRVFTPPFNIVKYIKEISNVELQFKDDNSNDYYEKLYANVEGSKQTLGLMNRQVVLEDNNEDENNVDFGSFNPDAILTNKTDQIYISKNDYSVPPNEDFLSNNTLWPEECKLYGHGCEIFSIGISHDSKFLASAQKAQTEKNAKLYLWNITTGKVIQQLNGHKLTIIQIEFSKSDKYILTSSRDRGWCVYQRNDDGESYALYQYMKNAHARIIWSCSWAEDEKFFITGSRDKNVMIWGKGEDNKFKLNSKKDYDDAVTAVEMIKICNNEYREVYLFICGLESGKIYLNSFNCNSKEIKVLYQWNKYLYHGKAVKRIKSVVIGNNIIRVGTCSDDYSVRIFELVLKEIYKLI